MNYSKLKKIIPAGLWREIKRAIYKTKMIVPDRMWLKHRYHSRFGRPCDLEHPRTFNEKIQWLKLYNRRPEYTQMVDKYGVRALVADKIGEGYLIPLVGGPWSSFDEIDFNSLPDQFVLKCTHDSGGLVICRDKSKLDTKAAKEKIAKSLRMNYYWNSREWPYKNVKPRIIAEKYMEDHSSENLNVYKIFTFNGQPKIIQTIQNDKTPDEAIDYFDCEWNLLDLRQNFPNSGSPLPRPETLEEMLRLAGEMSKGFPFLRIDLYEINKRVYFSEFTFFSDSGMAAFSPESWDEELGRLISLDGIR